MRFSTFPKILNQPVAKKTLITIACAVALNESACANPAQPQAVGAPTTADSYFNQAESASRSGGDMSSYSQQMQSSSLAMYPEYWQLNNSLSSQSPQTIVNFAQRYNGSVMAEKLTADYAEAKAAAGDYAAVRAVASYIRNPDASEACAIALGFNHGGDMMRGLVEKPNVWLDTNKKQPELCRQLATEMNANPMISNSDRDERLYRMLRTGSNGDIVQLASRLGVSIDYNQLMSVSSSPLAFMNNAVNLPATASNRYLYLYGLAQLAKGSVSQAAMQLQSDQARNPRFFDSKTLAYAYRTLGVARMNVNTDIGFSAEAVDWMQKSLGVPFNFEEVEDYAQASIRFSRWTDVANAIGAMDYKTQQQPIWRYWLARAYNQGNINQKQQARQIFSELAQNNDYYGLLAKDQIGQRFDRLPTNPSPTANDYNRLAQDANFRRAFTLYNLSAIPSYTNREWNWAVRTARERGDIPLVVAAAQTATNMGWYDRAIYAIDSGDDSIPNSALAFPMPFQSSVLSHSQRYGVDPAWVYGIARQESRFNVGAKSGVGAGGLTQLMPDTAKYVARKLGESYDAGRVAQADTNIRYGTYYMSDILGKLGGQQVLATAGYNAGPNKAKTWQPDLGSLPADQYVESIPYPETRNYVKAVMENATNYNVLLGGANTPISQRMGVVPSKLAY